MADNSIPKYVLWPYTPSIAGAIVAAIVFATITVLPTWKLFNHRTWFCIPFVVGGVFETIGYAARAAAHNNTESLTPYIIQFMLILWPPILVAASVYMILGRLIRRTESSSYSIIRAIFIYRRAKDVDTAVGDWFAELVKPDAWLKDIVPNFRVVPQSEVPVGMEGGTCFTSVCINTVVYLPYLLSQCLKHGTVVRRGTVAHISEAADLHHSDQKADLVVNCTGLGSLCLGGVEDTSLYPARGPIVLVRNSVDTITTVSGTDDGPEEAAYIMNRAAGGGCVLGGCLQANNWQSQPDPNLAVRIMKRAIELCPQLVPDGKGIEALDIIRYSVGLRPMRTDGVRVEREVIKGVPIVHNYGHGGYGYQSGHGCANQVVKLVDQTLKPRPKL